MDRHRNNESAAIPGHGSYLFLIDDEQHIHPLPHGVYVALGRGEATAPEFAGKTLRMADWYVRLEDGAPAAVVNETYGMLGFDADGRVAAQDAADASWSPTETERASMRALPFG